jgi:hypothetical protein
MLLNKRCPTASCVCAPKVAGKNIDMFKTKAFSFNHIVTDLQKELLGNGSVNTFQHATKMGVVL